MACLALMLLVLSMAGHSSASWCVCKDLDSNTLQKTLDYACGAGADCNPTRQNQQCYQPNTVRAHCSYAVNSYFQKHGQQAIACDFAGSAMISSTDPSVQGCSYPATGSSSTGQMTPPTTGTGGTSTGGTSTGGTSTGMGPPSTTMPGSPIVTTPSGGGILGGTSPGTLGPSGINNDISEGGARLTTTILLCFSIILTFSALVL
ncbi:hypothetical protein CASFOL_038269 [Castilleja foliolosa]|uniref:X8 domain-containing protein n=1 Tax=Castilleja foliolosa TaxID=1961234 RepID=A0ABD3BKH7_9LAMI